MADIRRQTPDIQPVNFIRPGVEDKSASVLAEGLGNVIQGGLHIDKMAAQERFGNALENLRSQYISSQAPASEEAEPDVGTELTGNDQRSLKDFEQVLGTNGKAVEQGRMTDAQFRMKAERLYRIAISKRPGLATEFRQVAASYLGMDVVGATVDFIAQQQAEELRAAAAATKSKADMEMDRFKFLRDEMVKAGIADAAFLSGPGPEADALFAANMERYAKVKTAQAELEAVESTAKVLKASGTINQSANQARYTAHINALTTGFPQAIDSALADLQSKGLQGDPEAVYSTAQGLLNELDAKMAEVNAAFADHEVSADFRQSQMQRITFLREQLMKRISGERDSNFAKNTVDWLVQTKEISLRSNDDFNTMSVLYKNLPEPTADRLAKDMDAALLGVVNDLMQEGTSFKTNVKMAPQAVNRIVQAVWPKGEPVDEQAVDKATTAISRALMSFYLGEDQDFDVGLFTQSGTKEGVVKQLAQYAPMMKGMTDEQRADITAAMGGAVANSVRVLTRRMFAKATTLQGKIDLAGLYTPDAQGRVFRPKAGVKLTPAEQAVVNQYNAQVNVPIVNKAMAAWGGLSSKEAWKYIASTHKDVTQARAEVAISRQVTEEEEQPKAGGRKIQTWWK